MPTKTFRSSVTRKFLEAFDNPFPGIVASSIFQKTNIVDGIVEYNTQGWYSRAEAFYRLGRDSYVRGLPDEVDINGNVNIVELRNTIETSLSNKIIFNYAYLDNMADDHYIHQYLQDTRHMNPITFVIPPEYIPTGTGPTVDGDFIYIGFTKTELMDGFIIQYSYLSLGETNYREEVIPIVYTNEFVYQVSYFNLNENLVSDNIPKYWMYKQGQGTYPILDLEYVSTAVTEGRYYPIVPFYIDKLEVGNEDNSSTELYQDSKKLITKMGFDYSELVASLAEGTEESIGKNKGLWAYLYLGVSVTEGILAPSNSISASEEEILNARKEAQASIRYLIEFFKKESVNSKYTKARFDLWKSSPSTTVTKYNTVSITNEEFQSEINYFYINITNKTGVISNKIGWCESEFFEDYVLVPLDFGNPEGVDNIPADTSKLIYRIQETASTYLEIEVVGLHQTYFLKDNYVYIYVKAAFDVGDEAIITVPLDRFLVKSKIPGILKNRLIHSSLNMVFNAYIRVEVKWYQTFWFNFIFTAIALYLAIPSEGVSLSWTSVTTIAGLKATAYVLVVTYLKYLVFNALIKFVAKQFGVGAAYVLSILTMAYGKGVKSGAFPKLPWAGDLLSIGSSMWSSSNNYVQEQLKDIERKYDGFSDAMDAANKDLQEAQKLLNVDADLNPWLFVNPLPDLMFSQDADTFINVRVHNSNPGISSLEGPSNYVDLMLTLPTIDDTLTK